MFQGVHETICFGPAATPWAEGEEPVNQIVFIGRNLLRKVGARRGLLCMLARCVAWSMLAALPRSSGQRRLLAWLPWRLPSAVAGAAAGLAVMAHGLTCAWRGHVRGPLALALVQDLVEGLRSCVWVPLPEGWAEHFDPRTNQPYYINAGEARGAAVGLASTRVASARAHGGIPTYP